MCGDTASGILMGLTLSKIISRLLIGCIKQQPQSPQRPQSLLICWYNFMHRALAWIATQSRPCIFYDMAAVRRYTKAYLTTAALYWQQFTQTEQPQSEWLAKSYLWAKAAFIASVIKTTKI